MRGMDPSLIAAFKTVFVVVAALLPILDPPGAVQILWNGMAELLEPWKAVRR